jgi:hypothetical protein
MKILDQGCTCVSCSKIILKELQESKEKWNNNERNIVFESYHHECGDGCCDYYGRNVYVNGFNINCDGENSESVVESLMEFLEIDNVNIEYKYEDED